MTWKFKAVDQQGKTVKLFESVNEAQRFTSYWNVERNESQWLRVLNIEKRMPNRQSKMKSKDTK